MIRRIVQFGPLTVGLTILVTGLVFGLTDWAWRLEGSPSESYPEIFFLGIVAPVGLLVSGLGWLWARFVQRRDERKRATS